MTQITFPLKSRQSGARVADLQDLLLRLLNGGDILPGDEAARRTLIERLTAERGRSAYGATTVRVVTQFQIEQGLEATGAVDEATAGALNDLRGGEAPPVFSSALYDGARGWDVSIVHDLLRGLGFDIAPDEVKDRRFGATTVSVVLAWRRQKGLAAAAGLDTEALAQLWREGRETPRVVRGTVTLEDGLPAPGLLVSAFDRDFRAEQPLGQAVTDRQGRYRIPYDAGAFSRAEKAAADLGLRVHGPGGKALLFAMTGQDILMSAPREAVVDISIKLPAGMLPSQFEQIAEDLRPLVRGVPFDDIARETGSDEGAFLAREAGFDVGAVAHFVVAHRLAQMSGVAADYFYALLREDGLYGIGPNRPRAVLGPVGFETDTRPVLFEAVLLDPAAARAAIQRAVRKRLVSPAVTKRAAAAAKALARWRDEALAYVGQEAPRRILGLVEDLIAAGKTEEMLAFLGSFDVTELDGLFDRLDARSAFGAADRGKAKARLNLAELLGFNLGLVSEVTDSLGAKTPEAVRKLARLERKDWTRLIERGQARVAPNAPKVDAALARRQSSVVVRRFEKAFPTTAFAAQLERRKSKAIPAHKDIAAFLAAHPDLELRNQRIVPFLKQAGVDPASVPPAVMGEVEKVQRVFQLAGDYRKTEGLLAAGYTAAADIVAAGRSQFLTDARASGAMAAAEAEAVFHAAETTNLGAVMLASNLRTLSWPAALAGPSGGAYATHIEQIIADQPDLAALFGPTDACTCAHCRSIYGPAAYFADVMKFMRNRLVRDTTTPPGPSTKTAKTVLFGRRPDLGEIDLNCDNALIEVPHIDIVCELAEEAVAADQGFAYSGTMARGAAPTALLTAVRGAGFEITDAAIVYGPYAPGRFMLRDKVITLAIDGGGSSWTLRRLRQTHGTAEERAASPEYVNKQAYIDVAAAKAAFGLPYDLFHAETRAFLSAAGIDRAELMTALAVAGSPSEAEIATETLGLSKGEGERVFAPDVADQPVIWSVPAPDAFKAMKKMNVFMQRTELEFEQVEALLTGRYVRGGVDLYIKHLKLNCDLADKEIVDLDDKVLDRIHRVLRLSRKTGLTPRDIDRLAHGPRLGGGDLGPAALRALGHLTRLSADLGAGIGAMVTWLDVIPTDGERAEHGLLFQNPAVTGPLDARLTPAGIAANEAAEIATPGSGLRLSVLASDIALAFGVRRADIDVLSGRLADAALRGPNPPLDFAALAALYGRVGLARALSLKAADLVALERLSGIDPLADAAALARFVATVRAVEKAGVPVADLDYRLARNAPDLAARDLSDDAIGPVLRAIQTGLVAAAKANASPYDDALTALEQVVPFEALLQRQPGLEDSKAALLVKIIQADAPTAADGAAAKAVVDSSLAAAVTAATVKAAIDTVVTTPNDANRKVVLKLIMDGLSAAGLKAASFEAANGPVAALLRLDADRSEAVLRGARLKIGLTPTPLVELFTTGVIALPATVFTPLGQPDLYRGLRLAWSIAGLVEPFEPSAETLGFMFANAAALGWLPLDGSRFETAMPVVPLADWLELAEVFALIEDFPTVPLPGQPGQTVSVLAVFKLALGGGPAKGPLLDALAILTGWPRAVIADADGRLAFTLAQYREPATWRALGRAVAALHRLNVPIGEAVRYTAAALDDADRTNARRMLRARYADADWLPALKSIMDPIREQKRDALVAMLMALNPNLTSKADLYDHFLTDTQWSAKMPSSRLVQAHGTLQLFIQRCIAGLEPKATADLDGDQDWRWWDWMKNYRVWEVNRKVFVEAQYYLRPEWRDDKSEPFVEMEGALLQNELNEENINAAFEGYLDGLDKIAFLDVLATCYDFDRQDLHVFASTKGGEPRSYYYRVLQRERVWTPWTKLDLDIAGDHLVAFFRNKRLYLAWATFMERADDQQEADYPAATPTTRKLPAAERWTEIALAVSEYTGKKWLPRRVSKGVVRTQVEVASLPHEKLFLTVNPDEKQFTVDVYREAWKTGPTVLSRIGSFLLTGCKGYPEARQGPWGLYSYDPTFKDTTIDGQRLVERNADGADDQLTMTGILGGGSHQTLFNRTPGIFRVTYPFQASVLDTFLTSFMGGLRGKHSREMGTMIFGTLMPFFFEDNQRGYILMPGFYGDLDEKTGARKIVRTFSNVRQLFSDVLAFTTQYLTLLGAAQGFAEQESIIGRMVADPEYSRLLAEIGSYADAPFGIVVRNFYHPMVCRLRQRFFEGGPAALLARSTQLEVGSFRFEDPVSGHAPDPIIVPPYPREEMEFGRESAYGSYNWELTYHAPHLIAAKLMEAERFDEAETWLRYIFDPLGSSNDPAPARYWNTKPFYLRDAADYADQVVTAIMDRLGHDPDGVVETELADTVLEWRRNPIKPYLVARGRTVAFQQAIVDLTIRMFIGRGDQFFRRDQLEDLVMASLDYSRAERLLGPRPKLVPPAIEVPPETYNQLESKLDLFGNALRKLENLLPDLSVLPHGGSELPPLPLDLESLYFGIPPSEKLFQLWDLLEERQANLRNSRTIDGVERSLSLFAPPLSVEEMIKAAAGGLSISAILGALGAPRPPYRFRAMLRHAIELADVAQNFSKELEQALASRDGEALSRLKADQEIRLLKEQTVHLKQEILAATRSIESARKTRQLHQETQSFYAGRPYMNGWEIAANISYGLGFAAQAIMAIGYVAAGGLSLVPSFMLGAAGFGGTPTVTAETGGKDYGQSARDLMVGTVNALGAAADKAGSMLEHQANYKIRKEDWDHSAKAAQREMEKTDIEIAIAGIRESIAKEQLRLNGVTQQQAAATEAFLRTKFTNRELYDWLAQELRGLSKQMFNLAFEAGKAAERCFNFELGLTESFVRSGQWNDARRGLTGAQNLVADLRRMDSSYYKRNVREREMTKHLSLARLDPIALLELRAKGRCVIQVPEAVFDLEHPGQYFRRIKALSVSIPCVAGPYASVPVKLTQTSNRVRWNTTKNGTGTDAETYAEVATGDPRFRYNVGSIQSIATSRAEDDPGLFNLNLDDERYLPFEGSGLVGTFVLELPPGLRPFDYGTIADVVLNIRYTARDGGGAFRTQVSNGVRERLNVLALKAGRVGLFQAIDIKRDRPNVWAQLTTTGASTLTLTRDDLPYYTSSRAITIGASRVVAKVKGAPTSFSMTVGGAATLDALIEPDLVGMLAGSVSGVAVNVPLTLASALPNQLEELVVIVNYQMAP